MLADPELQLVPALKVEAAIRELLRGSRGEDAPSLLGRASVVSERQRVSSSESTAASVVVTMRPVGPSFSMRRPVRFPSPSTVPWTIRPSERRTRSMATISSSS